MSIILEQQSKCPICNTILDDSCEYILVPHIISNIKDPLFAFSDAGVHIDCIDQSGFGSKLLQHIDLYNKHFPPSELKCLVDGKKIDHPEDLLFFGLLSSNEMEDLYQFNYLTFNLKNIGKWKKLNEFMSISEKFLSEGKWEGLKGFNKLEFITNKIKESY